MNLCVAQGTLHARDTDVIKIRTEINFNSDKSRRLIKQALAKEQQLAVHHLHKTWLLITEHHEQQNTETISIANICSRLKPLHIELKPAADRQQNLKLLTAVFRMYLTLAKNTNHKLREGLSNTVKTVVHWTVEQLSLEHRQWLKDLPEFEETEEWFAVHGAPLDPAFFYGYVSAMTYEDNLSYMQDNNIRVCFHGHSHMAGVFARDKKGMDHQLTEKTVSVSLYNQLLICPGSIGQPR